MLQLLTKLQVTSFYIKLQVENCELNLELQFEKFAESNFETASCQSFLWIELSNCMSLKLVGVTEN